MRDIMDVQMEIDQLEEEVVVMLVQNSSLVPRKHALLHKIPKRTQLNKIKIQEK